MKPGTRSALIAAAVDLADTLAEENRALRELDVTRAVALLRRKQAATATFACAHAATSSLTPDQLALARQVAQRLTEASAENKRLLERAIAVQGQVVATLVRAIPPVRPGYGKHSAQPPAMTLRARV